MCCFSDKLPDLLEAHVIGSSGKLLDLPKATADGSSDNLLKLADPAAMPKQLAPLTSHCEVTLKQLASDKCSLQVLLTSRWCLPCPVKLAAAL